MISELPSITNNPQAECFDAEVIGVDGIVQFGCCDVLEGGLSKSPLLHAHECYQCTFCDSGSMRFYGTGGRKWSLHPREMLIIPPGVKHRLERNCPGNRRFWVFFSLPFTKGALGGLPARELRWLSERLSTKHQMVRRITDSDCDLPGRILKLLKDTSMNAGDREFLLLNHFRRLMTVIACSKAEALPTGKTVEIARRMLENPGEDFCVDGIAAEMGVSVSTAIDRFRERLGSTPYRYLTHCRICKAMDFLRTTDMSITAISAELGFASSQHFASVFKREVGMTASDWRAKF